MNKSIITTLTLIFFALAGQVSAMEMDHSKHNMAPSAQDTMDHNKHATMDHSQHVGELIGTSAQDGFTFTYHVIDMKEKMAGMKDSGAPAEMKSHHLMVYVTDAHGKAMESAKIGYLVTSPNGSIQKAMTMGMGGGFGADVDFTAKGSYTIKTKLIADDTKLVNVFSYEVK
ncbi:MAG: hypothetical protein KKE17_15340 [Proteobacteria bacterium]|nr:hypothetical protein [Pseudomonadota bacterium]MBU1711374.1 hypothetical protein [Pseudomonadota bacterium]